jgi:hypothetical protein
MLVILLEVGRQQVACRGVWIKAGCLATNFKKYVTLLPTEKLPTPIAKYPT